MFSFKN